MKNATLCYIFNEGKMLLQKKSEGLFGGGRWNAPGGKLKFAESPEKAAIREVWEETGLKVSDLKNVGLLNFMEEGGKWFSVHVFIAGSFSGEPVNKGEGELKWFPAESIPYKEMWEDDSFWFPLLLEGKKFRGDFLFSKGFKEMLKHKVEELK